MANTTNRAAKEFGDFQTPQTLADAVCDVLQRIGVKPTHVVEPTCGHGAFLIAATRAFPRAKRFFGVEINPLHFQEANQKLEENVRIGRLDLYRGDFFKFDWEGIFKVHSGKWLLIGNPPWVTSSALGSISSDNLPPKSNFDGLTGIAARTGKSNFDISEWMLLQHIEFLRSHGGWLAMLVKTSVARKVLARAWRNKFPIKSSALYLIDAVANFGASVEACLLVLEMETGAQTSDCKVFSDAHSRTPVSTIGFHDNYVVSNVPNYVRLRNLGGSESHYRWRSGVKHDCSKVMEFVRVGEGYRNGFGEIARLDHDTIFPMLKSSDIGNGRTQRNLHMLITQRTTGEDTERLRFSAPRSWEYLTKYESLLGRRGSSIYRNRPPFAIFGVGDYSFAPWKIAISGFYKKLKFVPVEPVAGRPVMVDDTVNFIPCWSRDEAIFLGEMLNSDVAREFFDAMVFWSDKRPITIDLLRRLSIEKVAAFLGRQAEYARFTGNRLSTLGLRRAG